MIPAACPHSTVVIRALQPFLKSYWTPLYTGWCGDPLVKACQWTCSKLTRSSELMYPIMSSLRCTHVSHHSADMVSAVAGSDHRTTSLCRVGIRVHATVSVRHQACEIKMWSYSDKCRRSGHLSDNDICPNKNILLIINAIKIRTNVADLDICPTTTLVRK